MKFLYSVLIGGIAVNAAPAVPAAFSGTKSASQQAVYDAASAIQSDLDTNYATASAKAEGERTLWDNMWIALYDVFDADYENKFTTVDSFSGYQKDFNKLMNTVSKLNNAYGKKTDLWQGKIDQQAAVGELTSKIASKLQASIDKASDLAADQSAKKAAAVAKHAAWVAQTAGKLSKLADNISDRADRIAAGQAKTAAQLAAAQAKASAHATLEGEKQAAAQAKKAAFASLVSSKQSAMSASHSSKAAAIAAKKAAFQAKQAAKRAEILARREEVKAHNGIE